MVYTKGVVGQQKGGAHSLSRVCLIKKNELSIAVSAESHIFDTIK